MSKLIEQVAKEILEKYNQTIFCAGDLSIMHDIYDECVKRGMKPVPDCGNGPHPQDVRKRIREGMRTGYYFEVSWAPESICKKLSFYKLKDSQDKGE